MAQRWQDENNENLRRNQEINARLARGETVNLTATTVGFGTDVRLSELLAYIHKLENII